MEKKIILLFLAPFLIFWHWFEPAAKKNQQGVKAYQEKRYKSALQEFLSAKGIKPDLPELKNNTASTLYQLKKYQEALEEFSSINPEKSGISRSDFLYNLANSYFRVGQYDKALENYKNSLLIDPDDLDAKKNYEITLQKLNEQKKQQDQKSGEQDQENKKKQEQQQQKESKKNEKQHRNLMQYLDQNEKKQMEKKKRKIAVVKKEKDW
jgi:Ca-activated chloride channel family protein